MKTFFSSLVFTFLSLIAAFFVGYFDRTSVGSSVELGLKAVFIAFVLTVLEVSLSFDNAVVNASILQKMNAVWQRRFLTWGILVAVFGMRLIFPLAIVAVIASIGPVEALKMSVFDPQQYAEIMLSTHHMVSAFGGAFLLLVCLRYFFDPEKETHWFSFFERTLARLGKMQAVELAMVLGLFIFLSKLLPETKQMEYLISALWGLVVFVLVDGVAALFETQEVGVDANKVMASSGLGLFMYLEVLDASFSFDGVVGAFAITQNLFIIMLGLGSGAFFVRSMTIYLVEKKTLHQFEFLEHGAFYAIGALGMIMIISPFVHVSEWITGFVGVLILGLSIWASRSSPQVAKSKS